MAINLDTSSLSAGILTKTRSANKLGFDLDEKGKVHPLGESARELLEMSVFDDVKKANRLTYQEIIYRIIGLEPPAGEIILELTPQEKKFALEFAMREGLDENRLTVGFNTGGGGRWLHKRWTEEGTVKAIRHCLGELDAQVVLYGGPEEEDRNRRIMSAVGEQAHDAGCHNSLREFFALLNLSDILVTSDSMALHAAQGLGKKIVAFFGPTSAWEIELYDRGERVISPVDCQCCYLPDCDRSPTCMESITPEMVMDALARLI